ncbi:hypothetical protein BU23DRAFT_243659 [Bimuria novae-zelandiae CBS 107.79]|uniref:Uncharacterized protein n=1 Tax=Bimuria novae-zelandiae CBS 107.79 TaxID=1447943 RepID=A0A6A5UWQ6_9PLEO|nr:hypothetical protein BU23DRAFT_243659 [Bimuria novae-zelandiae CBS 107.79]
MPLNHRLVWISSCTFASRKASANYAGTSKRMRSQRLSSRSSTLTSSRYTSVPSLFFCASSKIHAIPLYRAGYPDDFSTSSIHWRWPELPEARMPAGDVKFICSDCRLGRRRATTLRFGSFEWTKPASSVLGLPSAANLNQSPAGTRSYWSRTKMEKSAGTYPTTAQRLPNPNHIPVCAGLSK